MDRYCKFISASPLRLRGSVFLKTERTLTLGRPTSGHATKRKTWRASLLAPAALLACGVNRTDADVRASDKRTRHKRKNVACELARAYGVVGRSTEHGARRTEHRKVCLTPTSGRPTIRQAHGPRQADTPRKEKRGVRACSRLWRCWPAVPPELKLTLAQVPHLDCFVVYQRLALKISDLPPLHFAHALSGVLWSPKEFTNSILVNAFLMRCIRNGTDIN
jgi:hypothetical protein